MTFAEVAVMLWARQNGMEIIEVEYIPQNTEKEDLE